MRQRNRRERQVDRGAERVTASHLQVFVASGVSLLGFARLIVRTGGHRASRVEVHVGTGGHRASRVEVHVGREQTIRGLKRAIASVHRIESGVVLTDRDVVLGTIHLGTSRAAT